MLDLGHCTLLSSGYRNLLNMTCNKPCATVVRALLIGILLIVPYASTWAGFEEGAAAYDRGDYEAAMREWRPLADGGHRDAAFNVAEMFTFAQGVDQDNRAAFHYYLVVAEYGHAQAQLKVGNLYWDGLGVGRDMRYALMWYFIALDNVALPANDRLFTQAMLGAWYQACAMEYEACKKIYEEAENMARDWKPKTS